MFLHIGGGKTLNKNDIIAVLDLETTSISKKTREFLSNCEKEKLVINVSEDIPKTYIICKSKKTNVYISQISSQTLFKRAESFSDISSMAIYPLKI